MATMNSITALDGTVVELEDSAARGKVLNLTLPTLWTGTGPYTQQISVAQYTVTAKTVVDLSCDAATIAQMNADGTTQIYISNSNGVLTAYAYGKMPTESLTVIARFTEVI